MLWGYIAVIFCVTATSAVAVDSTVPLPSVSVVPIGKSDPNHLDASIIRAFPSSTALYEVHIKTSAPEALMSASGTGLEFIAPKNKHSTQCLRHNEKMCQQTWAFTGPQPKGTVVLCSSVQKANCWKLHIAPSVSKHGNAWPVATALKRAHIDSSNKQSFDTSDKMTIHLHTPHDTKAVIESVEACYDTTTYDAHYPDTTACGSAHVASVLLYGKELDGVSGLSPEAMLKLYRQKAKDEAGVDVSPDGTRITIPMHLVAMSAPTTHQETKDKKTSLPPVTFRVTYGIVTPQRALLHTPHHVGVIRKLVVCTDQAMCTSTRMPHAPTAKYHYGYGYGYPYGYGHPYYPDQDYEIQYHGTSGNGTITVKIDNDRTLYDHYYTGGALLFFGVLICCILFSAAGWWGWDDTTHTHHPSSAHHHDTPKYHAYPIYNYHEHN